MSQDSLPVVILAGGKGTRIAAISGDLPKAMLPIAGKPFVAHQLRLLRNQGIQQVIFCVGYRSNVLENFIHDGAAFDLRVSYVHDGKTLRGTGGALQAAFPALPDTFFVMYGDSYLNCDYAAIQKHFENTKKLGLMTVYKNDHQFDTSNIIYDGQNILCYDKRNPSHDMQHIDYGLSIFSKAAFLAFSNRAVFDLSEVHAYLVAQGQLAAFEVSKRFYEIGSLSGIAEMEKLIANQPSY